MPTSPISRIFPIMAIRQTIQRGFDEHSRNCAVCFACARDSRPPIQTAKGTIDCVDSETLRTRLISSRKPFVGFYDRHILPRLLDAAMSANPITHQRRKVVPRAEGRVLEIGFGAGHNLPFYDASKVQQIWALEPAAEMRARAGERAAASPIPMGFLGLPSEKLPPHPPAARTRPRTLTSC